MKGHSTERAARVIIRVHKDQELTAKKTLLAIDELFSDDDLYDKQSLVAIGTIIEVWKDKGSPR